MFPATDPIVSLILSFATFAVGYLARPIGGIVLSHYGDRHGRRAVFLWSVFIMSGATLGMGLVPTYASWGVGASILMVTLRLIQGFCLGGELPGALTYVVETAPRIAPFVCGVVFACVTMGVAVATGVSLSVRTLHGSGADPDLWLAHRVHPRRPRRRPELRAAALARGIARIRTDAQPGRASAVPRTAARPIARTCWSAARCWPAPAASTACSSRTCRRICPACCSTTRARRCSRRPIGVIASSLGILVDGVARRSHSAALPAAGRRGVCCWCLRYPFYAALESRSMNLTLICTLAGLAAGLTNGSFAVLLTDLFPTRVRFTGVALVFNVSFTIFSGTAPLVATSLIRETGRATSPAYMMMVSAALALIGSIWVDRLGGNVII